MNYEDFVKTFSQHSVMTIAELASTYQVSPRTIGRWKKRYHDEQNAQPEKSDENPFAGVPGIVPVDRQYPKHVPVTYEVEEHTKGGLLTGVTIKRLIGDVGRDSVFFGNGGWVDCLQILSQWRGGQKNFSEYFEDYSAKYEGNNIIVANIRKGYAIVELFTPDHHMYEKIDNVIRYDSLGCLEEDELFGIEYEEDPVYKETRVHYSASDSKTDPDGKRCFTSVRRKIGEITDNIVDYVDCNDLTKEMYLKLRRKLMEESLDIHGVFDIVADRFSVSWTGNDEIRVARVDAVDKTKAVIRVLTADDGGQEYEDVFLCCHFGCFHDYNWDSLFSEYDAREDMAEYEELEQPTSNTITLFEYVEDGNGINVIKICKDNTNIKFIHVGDGEFDKLWNTTRDGTFYNIDWSYLFEEEHVPEETEDNRYEYVLIPGEVTIYKINSAGIVPRVFKSDSREFSKILAKITQGDDDFMEFFVDALVEQVNILTDNRVKITNSNISVDGFDLSNELSNEILSRISTGGLESVGSLIKFLDNLVANPDSRVFDQLYSFIKHNDIEIDDDGNIVAYKRVRSDYKDVHSGTMDNHPGTVVTMPRFKVNNNPEQTCAPGLHVCAAPYLPHFGGERIVRVKINPKDVVSIPTDYNGAKMRVCEYVVIDDVTEDMS